MSATATKSNQELADDCVTAFGDLLLFDEETSTFWQHDAKRRIWSPTNRRKFFAALTRIVRRVDPNNRYTTGRIEDVVKLMYDGARKVDRMDETHLSFTDCQLDLVTLMPVEYDVKNISLVSVPIAYADLHTAKSPLFDEYLNETCTALDGTQNKEMRLQLQEIAGFILSSPTIDRMEKFILFWGEGSNGKSPMIDFLVALVGEDLTTFMPLDAITSDGSSMCQLVGKKLNANTEEESAKVMLSFLKRASSGERFTARRHYELPFTFRCFCRFVFSSNPAPRLDGFDKATRRRMMVIPFEHEIEDKKADKFLSKKIIAQEFPALVRWALDGLKRLRLQNHVFTVSVQSLAAIDDIEDSNNSAMAYIRSDWVKDNDGKIEGEILFNLYRSWCKNNNRKEMSAQRFRRDCTRVFGQSFVGWDGDKKKTTRFFKAALSLPPELKQAFMPLTNGDNSEF